MKKSEYILSDGSVLSHYPGKGPALLFVHGSMEDSSIFASKDFQKGLAPFLSQKGFDCWLYDLPGRKDPMKKRDQRGQTHVIFKSMPEVQSILNKQVPNKKQFWIAHSWGGVILGSSYVAPGIERDKVYGMVFLSVKRKVTVQNPRKWFFLDFMWKFVGSVATAAVGKMPIKAMGYGPKDETYRYFFDILPWIASRSKWSLKQPAFDFEKEWKSNNLKVDTLSLTGAHDYYLGHPKDCQLFLDEMGSSQKVQVLSLENGNKKNYDHVNIMTAKEALNDHFPLIERWLSERA